MTNTRYILFLVPIYRETKAEYYASLDREDEQRRKEETQRIERLFGKSSISAEEVDEIENRFISCLNRMNWRYNRIMGWIEFYSDRRTIKADRVIRWGQIFNHDISPVKIKDLTP